jgi:predicted Holliday junction resolvase-like endonuclease
MIDEIKEKKMINIVFFRIVFIVFTCVLVVIVLTGWCYRNSTQERTTEKVLNLIKEEDDKEDKVYQEQKEDDRNDQRKYKKEKQAAKDRGDSVSSSDSQESSDMSDE